jgi:hypothetical protein
MCVAIIERGRFGGTWVSPRCCRRKPYSAMHTQRTWPAAGLTIPSAPATSKLSHGRASTSLDRKPHEVSKTWQPYPATIQLPRLRPALVGFGRTAYSPGASSDDWRRIEFAGPRCSGLLVVHAPPTPFDKLRRNGPGSHTACERRDHNIVEVATRCRLVGRERDRVLSNIGSSGATEESARSGLGPSPDLCHPIVQ